MAWTQLWDNGKVAGCAIAGLEPAVKGSPAKTIKLPAALSGSHNLKGKYFSPHITTWWTKWLPNVQKEHSFWKCGMWVPEMQQQPQGTHHSCYLRPPLPDYLLSKGFIFRSFTRYFRSSSRKGRLKKNKNTKSRTYWFLRIPPEFVCLFVCFGFFVCLFGFAVVLSEPMMRLLLIDFCLSRLSTTHPILLDNLF